MKEQRETDYVPTIDQVAGAEARRILRASRMEDTTENWRALKRAYLAGREDARRA